MKMPLCTLILFSLLFHISLQCGMVTHNEISQRAFFSFENPAFTNIDYHSYISSNQGYFEAASAYPDWGYLCQSPAGELSHWPPFLEAYKQYFLDNYSLNSPDTSYLLAFLFGVMAHDESDVLWHWGRQANFSDEQGFLHSMSHDSSDCLDKWNEGTDPTCHTMGDVGGDFFLAYRGGLDWLDTIWRVPTSDLSQIYQRMGLNISEWEIGGCMAVMFIGAIAEKVGAGLIFENYGKHAAFLAEEVDLWFMGGIDDMAINTQWKWVRMIEELEGRNISQGELKFRRDFPDALKMKAETLRKYGEILGVKVSDLGSKGVEIGFQKNLSLKGYKDFVSELKKDLNITIKESEKSKKSSQKTSKVQRTLHSDPQVFLSTHSYSYFGKSFTSGHYGNNSGTFVGAPGYSIPGNTQIGAIYFMKSHSLAEEINYKNPFWVGPEEYSRCGWALETVDLNHDGIDDLIVSCPSSGPGGVSDLYDYYPKTFYGKIFVFFGEENVGIRPQPDLAIVSHNVDDIFMNLGFQLSKGDCNNDGFSDLLIGSPFSKGSGGDQRGKVHLIQGLNKSDSSKGQKEIFLEDVATLEIQGDIDYQWFGYSMLCTQGQILVGSPGARSNQSIQASGKVFAYNLSRNQDSIQNSSLVWEIDCKDPQAKFGLSLALNPSNNILAVGASSFANENGYLHAGRVLLYNVSDIQSSKLTQSENFRSAISGSASYARFGHQVTWSNNDLIVSSPQYGDILGMKREKGAVFVYKNAGNFMTELDYESYDLSFYGLTGGGRFGAKIEVDPVSGNILIGSPWSWNDDSRLSGGLHIIQMEEDTNDTL